MTYGPEIIRTTIQRWRVGGISCFTWPSNQTDSVVLETDQVGQAVLVESKNRNWRRQVARGLNATTHFIAAEDILTYVPGHIFLGKWCPSSNRFGWYQCDGDLFLGHTAVWNKPPAASSVLDTQVLGEALSYAIRDARSKQSHFRGGNFLAELRDTIRGLRNPAKGFRDLLGTYRRNARARVKRATGRRTPPVSQADFRRLERDAPDVARAAQRALSDTWLEHNFGWQPLLSDAVDAYKALRALSARVPLVRFQGQSSRMTPPSYVTQTRFHDITTLRFTVRTYNEYSCRIYGAVKVQTDTPPSGQAIEEMGVQAQDFIPAVWEAIPYSFLIDYFANVGDVIEAVSFPRSDLAWVSRTYLNHSIRSTERVAAEETSSSYPAANSNKRFSFTAPRVQWDRRYVNRDVYGGSLVPSLRFEIPGARNWKKYFNIAALARLRTL